MKSPPSRTSTTRTSSSSRSSSVRLVNALPSVIGELVLVAAAGVTYAGVRELTEGSEATAVANAHALLDLERTLHLDWEEATQSLILGHDLLVDLANWTYIWGHWPVIAATAIALFALRRDRYRLLRNAVWRRQSGDPDEQRSPAHRGARTTGRTAYARGAR